MKSILILIILVSGSIVMTSCQPSVYGAQGKMGSHLVKSGQKKQFKKGVKRWQKSRPKRKRAYGKTCSGMRR